MCINQFSEKTLTPRLDVDIQTWTLELESSFSNSIVWMSLALRDGIEAHFHGIL
jgi:hypothetical protein